MSRRPPLILLIALLLPLLLVTGGCSGGHGDGSAYPKPKAYPRLEIPDSVYTSVEVAGTVLNVNDGAEVRISPGDSGAWIDITYPGFASPRVYLTLTVAPADSIGCVLANRSERMSLNLGGNMAELTELVSRGGWDCRMLLSHTSLTTPVQILASDGSSRVLSGALVLTLPDSLSADPAAVAPVIDAVGRDMLVTLKSL